MNDRLERFVDQIDAHHSDEAETWAKACVGSGDADAQFLMGYLTIAASDGDFREACAWYERAAAQDHPEALFQLSRIDQSEARKNWGPPLNDKMRARLRRAAELGSVRARAKLGEFYASGRGGFPKDEAEARAWYTRAAEAGDIDAQCGLSDLLMRKPGDTAALEEGIAWLEKAASSDQGSRMWDGYRASEALKSLSRIYGRGRPGIAPDAAKAAAFTKRLEAYQARIAEGVRAFRDAGLLDYDTRAFSTGANSERRSFPYENAQEAKQVLRAHMASYRGQTHKDLAGLVNKRIAASLRGPSGSDYDVVVEIRWDDQPLGAIHVCGTINDDGWEANEDVHEIFCLSSADTSANDANTTGAADLAQRRPETSAGQEPE